MKKFLLLLIAMVLVAPSFGQNDKTLKRKVAIGRFTNETQYAKGMFYDRENDPIRKQALDILSSKLAASGKFILLERDGLEELIAEAGEGMQKTKNDLIFIERDKPLGPEEIQKKLDILREALATGSNRAVKAALMKVVPTYHRPEEVNGKAANTSQ